MISSSSMLSWESETPPKATHQNKWSSLESVMKVLEKKEYTLWN